MALRTDRVSLSDSTLDKRLWVPDPDHCYSPCFVSRTDAGFVVFKTPQGKNLRYPVGEADKFDNVAQDQLQGVEDICSLSHVNEAALCHTVRTRFLDDHIYTRVSRIILAVNPFKSLPIYGVKQMKTFHGALDSTELPAHIFAIGHDAMKGVSREKSQVIFISGESGAGKTESTKLLISYIAESTAGVRGVKGGIEERLQSTNPVLEALGNARTTRNNNSSRFGKFIQISISPSQTIAGCKIVDYLLELTRVCKQGDGERNYHMFFALLQAEDLRTELDLRPPSAYRYLDALHVAPGIDDARNNDEVCQAFDTLGFSKAEQLDIMKVLLGLLTLGNTAFTDGDDDECACNTPDEVLKAASLLGVQPKDLEIPITKRQIKIGTEVTWGARNKVQAEQTRDALSRLMYGLLFKLVMARINEALGSDDDCFDLPFVGILDIAGFESFQVNSFEQLLINFVNEHLQSMFNENVFRMELEECAAEGIPTEGLSYQDNRPIIELMEARGGLLSMLDEEVFIPKATDESYTNNVQKAHGEHACFVTVKLQQKGVPQFGIKHFAMEVTYTCTGFIDKNTDKPPTEAADLFKASPNTIMQAMGGSLDMAANENTKATRTTTYSTPSSNAPRNTRQTVSSAFRRSLQDMLGLCQTAEPHFIRCFKPNLKNVANRLDSPYVFEQLTCSGVLEAARTIKQGYSARMKLADFVKNYGLLINSKKRTSDAKVVVNEVKELLRRQHANAALKSSEPFEENGLVVGSTRVFMRQKFHETLEHHKNLALTEYVRCIQRRVKRMWARKKRRVMALKMNELRAWLVRNNFYAEQGSQHTALFKLQTAEAIDDQRRLAGKLCDPFDVSWKVVAKTEDIAKRMGLEVEVLQQLGAGMTSVEPMLISQLIKRVEDLELPTTGGIAELQKRLDALKLQLPLAAAGRAALANRNVDDALEFIELVTRNDLSRFSVTTVQWLPEIHGEELMDQVSAMLDELGASEQRKLAEKEAREEAKLEDVKQDPLTSKRRSLASRNSGQRQTITGFSVEAVQQLTLQLMGAAELYDFPKMRSLLDEALKQGVTDSPQVLKAMQLYEMLEKKQPLAQLIASRKELVDQGHLEDDVIKGLVNLCAQAKTLGMSCEAAMETAQRAVRRRAQQGGSAVANMNKQDLLPTAFADLYDWKGLKDPDRWAGTWSASNLFGQAKKGREAMLRFGNSPVKEALTQLPEGHEMRARQNYLCILGWMYDRPVPSLQHPGLREDILDTAAAEMCLADEVYVQIMKQLTENPSLRSMRQGWKLMQALCYNTLPSSSLCDFVHAFLLRMARKADGGDMETINQCIKALTARDAALDEQQKTYMVLLVDDSTHRVSVHPRATLMQLRDRLCEQLRIDHGEDFSFFQASEGLPSHRLLPSKALICKIIEFWAKMREQAQVQTSLVFKRRYLRVNEALRLGDSLHATLTYRQLKYDFQRYPILEKMPVVCEIAAAILWAEPQQFGQTVKQKQLVDHGVLEDILPAKTLSIEHDHDKVWQLVADSYNKLKDSADGGESIVTRMSRVLTLMQSLRLFGVYHWRARQLPQVPREKESLKRTPTVTRSLDESNPKAEWWVCIDAYGIRFVSVDGAPGAATERSFFFAEQAVDKVLLCGAKKDVVTFVVNSANSSERAPEAVFMYTPAAVDVAYAFETFRAERARTEGEPPRPDVPRNERHVA